MLLRIATAILAIGFLADFARAGFGDAQPVPAGAVITLEVDKPQYFVGENVLVHLALKNTSDKPFSFEIGGDYRGGTRSARFIVTAVDEAGKEVADPDPNQFTFGGLATSPTLEPGETWYHSLSLPRYRAIDTAGTYTIRATHDFDWTEDATHKRPVGETKIKFVMPTAAEAEGVVAEMAAMKADEGWSYGEKRKPYPDFGALRSPIYFAPLIKLAEKGSAGALEGLSSIETPEATKALIELTSERNTAAATLLLLRMPEASWATRPAATQQWDAPRYARVQKTWDASFNEPVRAKARDMLRNGKTQAKICGARMIESVGTLDDRDLLTDEFERATWQAKPRKGADANVLDPPGTAPYCIRAMTALIHRGGKPVADPKRLGACQWNLLWAVENPNSRSEGIELSLSCLESGHFILREYALRALPSPMPEKAKAAMLKRFEDEDAGVQRVACEVAGAEKDPAFIPGVLKVIATANESFTLNSAGNAAVALGAKYEACEAWVHRMDDPKQAYSALAFLAGTIVKSPGSGWGGTTNLTAEQAGLLKQRWLAFLPKHRERIKAGRLFEIGEHELTEDLFRPGFAFSLKDGKSWPAREE